MGDNTQHSECSPSQVHRILACPGSRRMNRAYPQGTSSYAEEGTMLHSIVEQRMQVIIDSWTNQTPSRSPEVLDNKEHETIVQECIEYTCNILKSNIDIQLEASTSLRCFGLHECDGHSDVVITSPGRRDVIDYKFGAGIPVHAENNIQGMCYAAGSFKSKDELINTPEINIHIVQPRLDSFTKWTISGPKLLTWLDEVLIPGILASRVDYAPCIPGASQCRFCVGMRCPARNEKALNDAQVVFGEYIETQALVNRDITDKELSELLLKEKELKAFFSELNKYAMAQCVTSKGFPGHKLVSGRNSRKWRNEEEAQAFMTEMAESPDSVFDFSEVFETKFITVAKAEKLQKNLKSNKAFKALYNKIPGQAIMVRDSDPRPSVVQNAASVFAQFKQIK